MVLSLLQAARLTVLEQLQPQLEVSPRLVLLQVQGAALGGDLLLQNLLVWA
jgi:hypothetical protein